MKKKNDEINMVDLWHIFAPKLWIILLCGLLCAVLLFCYSDFLKKDTYTADTRVLVFYSRSPSDGVTTGEVQVSNLVLADYLAYMRSRDFMSQIAARLPAKYRDITYKDLSKIVKIEQLNDTEWLHIEVKTSNPDMSHDIARCIYDNAADIITKNLDLGIDITATNPPVAAAQILPNSKNVLRNTAIGFFVGVFLCAVVVFLRSLFDVVVHDRKQLENSFDLPILGVIPAWDIPESKDNISGSKEKTVNEGGNA